MARKGRGGSLATHSIHAATVSSPGARRYLRAMNQPPIWQLPLLPPRITGMPLVAELNAHLQLLHQHVVACEARIAELERRLAAAGEAGSPAD